MQACRNRRFVATRPPRLRPTLFVQLDPLRVSIVATDYLEQRELEPLAELVRHVLEHALGRGAGAA
jgi:hypothetical protein